MLFLATGDSALRRELYHFETISHSDYTCGRDFPANIIFYEEQLLNMKPMFKAACKSISMWNGNRHVMFNVTQNRDIYTVLEIYCYVN
jgi:hypothetical protein